MNYCLHSMRGMGLTPFEKLVLCALVNFYDEMRGHCDVPPRKIAQFCEIKKVTAIKAIETLIAKNIIAENHKYDRRGDIVSMYDLLFLEKGWKQ
jgi:DNA-binding MarR family transcriptional regulator